MPAGAEVRAEELAERIAMRSDMRSRKSVESVVVWSSGGRGDIGATGIWRDVKAGGWL